MPIGEIFLRLFQKKRADFAKTALPNGDRYENGVPYLCVDEELRRRLETKLIIKILDFKADKVN